jgi:hypothetical protein
MENMTAVLESFENSRKGIASRKVKKHLTRIGFRVVEMETPYGCEINDDFYIENNHYIKVGFNKPQTRLANCIQIPDPTTEIKLDKLFLINRFLKKIMKPIKSFYLDIKYRIQLYSFIRECNKLYKREK